MSDGFVLDAQVAASWGSQETRDLYSEDVLRLLESQPAHVPCHWRLEVASSVLKAQEAGAMSAADAATFLSLLESAPIAVDSSQSGEWILTVRALASRYGATAYEAAYLELCQRLGLPLATEDPKLKKLAKEAKLEIVSP